MDPFSDNELWTDEEQGYWLAFDRISGAHLGVAKLKLAFEQLFSLKTIWNGTRESLSEFKWFTDDMITAFLEKRKEIEPEKVFQEVKKSGVRAYPYFHPDYPFRLRHISDPPLIVYMKGQLNPNDLQHSCAIVGTRRPTSYGQRLSKQIAGGLARSGVSIISGMASGIDAIAHWGAIESGGKTVAVLGCGADVCYPASNRPLYDKLIEDKNCAVLSEFFPGTTPETWMFPARNRIISGLSQAVAVIEAGETSGSLITAKLAFEQNREVFAVPGRVDSPASKGTNYLIASNTAKLLTDYEEIMREMQWVSAAPVREVATIVELYGRERELYEMISNEPVHFDYLCEKSGIKAAELSASLTMLELAGVVTRHPGDWYSREQTVGST